MRLFVSFMVALIVATSPSAAENDLLSRAEFTQRFLAEFQARHPGVDFDQVEDGAISFGESADSDGRGMMFTDYAFDLYLADPTALSDIIDRWVAAVPLDGEIDESDAANRLVVVIRPPDYLNVIPESQRADLVSRPFLGDMIALMMLDSPQALSTASLDLLEENDLTVDEAFILAESNTRRLIGEIYSENYDGIDVLESSNGLVTALPWLPETCRAGVANFAMMIVDREFLMQVDMTKDPAAFEIFMHTATEMILNQESLATGVFMCVDGEWNFAVPMEQLNNPGSKSQSPDP